MIVIVKGKGKSGKTASLKKLIQRLLNDPRFRLYDACRNFAANMAIPYRDVWAKFCYGGVHILISTFGDSENGVQDTIDRHGSDCDIIICAGHPNHQIFACINGRKRELVEIDKIVLSFDDARDETEKQRVDAACDAANQEFADSLFDRLLSEAEKKRQEMSSLISQTVVL